MPCVSGDTSEVAWIMSAEGLAIILAAVVVVVIIIIVVVVVIILLIRRRSRLPRFQASLLSNFSFSC